MKKGQLKDAVAAFKALVDKDPTLADAHAGLVRCLLSTNQVEEADGAAKKALAALPRRQWFTQRLAMWLFDPGILAMPKKNTAQR